MKIRMSAKRWYLYVIPLSMLFFGVMFVAGLIIGET